MKTKCDSCSLATALLCGWIDRGKADKTMKIKNGQVVECLRYVKGELPDFKGSSFSIKSSLDGDYRLTQNIRSELRKENLCYLAGV